MKTSLRSSDCNTPAGYVSVKQFGASGDGSKNDCGAIKTAIASGKNIYFPKGYYLCIPNSITEGHLFIPEQGDTDRTFFFKTANQKIDFRGSTVLLRLMNIKISAVNVTIDLNDGIIDNGAQYTTVALSSVPQTVLADQCYLTVDDASVFKDGDVIESEFTYKLKDSKGNPTGDPIQPIGHYYEVKSGLKIARRNRNTLILWKYGTSQFRPSGCPSYPSGVPQDLNQVLPAGLVVGVFAWNSLLVCENGSANTLITNGTIQNVPGYFCANLITDTTEKNNVSITFNNVKFQKNGWDQFQFRNSSASFKDCYFGQQLEVAKSCISFGDGTKLVIDRCTFQRGGGDFEFNPFQTSYAVPINTAKTKNQGYLRVRNSLFNAHNYYIGSLSDLPPLFDSTIVINPELTRNSIGVFNKESSYLTGTWRTISFNGCVFDTTNPYFHPHLLYFYNRDCSTPSPLRIDTFIVKNTIAPKMYPIGYSYGIASCQKNYNVEIKVLDYGPCKKSPTNNYFYSENFPGSWLDSCHISARF